jgi:lipoprotein-anchoring transpeptidase ErfK/SrfK
VGGFQQMKSLSLVSVLSLFALTGAACVVPPAGNSTTNISNTPVSTASPSPTVPAPPAATTTSNAQPVPFPVLDAFFTDEAFTSDLKSQVGLTDEQIGRLRTVARAETAKLREDSTDNYQRSTLRAQRLADKQVKAILGDEKTQQLYAFLQERWNGTPPNGEPSLQKPNAVPTDTRIVVNVPAYRMDLYQDGKLIKTYKVGIGYPEFPLPTGLRKADSVIFNPTWTPPDEPWVEAANKVKPGEKIPAGSKLNPLGPAKIPIGLPSLIHGGKAPSKIGTFASHGCVGLTTPQLNEFLPLLTGLTGSPITQEDVANYEKDKTETKSVKLTQPVPVELRYETIVVEDGKLHIYRDVYDKDTNTEDNLRQVLAVYGVTPEDLSEAERTQISDALRDMSRDANGNLNTPNDKSDDDNKNSGSNNNAGKNKSPKVTLGVKGKKELVIDVAALQGKGYPAPVDLNTGGAPVDNTQKAKKPKTKK